MNCFVIMPFDQEFDDVYVSIKASVQRAASSKGCRCFRLDESRPAGRITDRLVQELQSATLCIADLTGNKPNVMWEVGYAMALGRPTIVITQHLQELPFDIRDMQSLQYDRSRLSASLGRPLEKMVNDTMAANSSSERRLTDKQANSEFVGQLLAQMSDLKSMVAQAVQSWEPGRAHAVEPRSVRASLSHLEGAWLNPESKSHLFAKVVRGDLIVPYCYGGDYELDSTYYGWRKVSELWFARFSWLNSHAAGFTFLRQESVNTLSGAWWGDERELGDGEGPPAQAGILSVWLRQKTKAPKWATQFWLDVERNGLPETLAAKRGTDVGRRRQRRLR